MLDIILSVVQVKCVIEIMECLIENFSLVVFT